MCVCVCGAGEEVGYAEVDHWMWRLFLDDYGSVCESLGLPPLPLSLNCSGTLPPPTPLLYGISPSVISRQPYWPDRYIASLVLALCFTSCSSLARHIPSVSLCGFWSLPPHFYPTLDPGVTALLHSFSTSPLYVGFGSMESYLLDMDWTALFVTLEEGKWVCSTCTNIVIAFETYFSSPKTCNKCTVPMSGEWSSPASLLNTTIKTSAHPPDTAGVVSLLAVSSVFGHFAPRGERNCRCFASF